ncbi:MAG: hypothetical protein MHM6MM_001862 [Cercozoa sp. M6MM]
MGREDGELETMPDVVVRAAKLLSPQLFRDSSLVAALEAPPHVPRRLYRLASGAGSAHDNGVDSNPNVVSERVLRMGGVLKRRDSRDLSPIHKATRSRLRPNRMRVVSKPLVTVDDTEDPSVPSLTLRDGRHAAFGTVRSASASESTSARESVSESSRASQLDDERRKKQSKRVRRLRKEQRENSSTPSLTVPTGKSRKKHRRVRSGSSMMSTESIPEFPPMKDMLSKNFKRRLKSLDIAKRGSATIGQLIDSLAQESIRREHERARMSTPGSPTRLSVTQFEDRAEPKPKVRSFQSFTTPQGEFHVSVESPTSSESEVEEAPLLRRKSRSPKSERSVRLLPRQSGTARTAPFDEIEEELEAEEEPLGETDLEFSDEERAAADKIMSGLNFQRFANARWFEVFQEPQKTPAEIATEVRMDRHFKTIRRNSRILLKRAADEEDAIEGPKRPHAPFIIWPDNKWRIRWDLFVALLVAYFAVITPVNMGFPDWEIEALWLDMLLNAFFICDLVLQFFTAFRHTKGPNEGKLETSHLVIAKTYLKKWFWIDLVASVPIDLLFSAYLGESSSAANLNRLVRLLRGFKLIRVLRISRIFKRLMMGTRINPSVIRLFKLLFGLIVMWHWMACFYWMIAGNRAGESAWTPTTKANTFGEAYAMAYFWAVMVTTGVGRDVDPHEYYEYWFSTVAITLGVFMYAFIVGSASSALSSLDGPEGEKRRKMEQLTQFMKQRHVNPHLQQQILEYYEYRWSRSLDDSNNEMLKDLHYGLWEDLQIDVNQKLIRKVPMFRETNQLTVLALINKLQSRIFLPGEVIYIYGERANEMFFVARGQFEVLNEYGERLRILGDGDFFGERGIMSASRREQTVRALVHSELLILKKTDFKNILRRFPDFATAMHKYTAAVTLRGWKKLAFCIKLCRMVNLLGGSAHFDEMMLSLNSTGDTAVKKLRNYTLGDVVNEILLRKGRKRRYESFSMNLKGGARWRKVNAALALGALRRPTGTEPAKKAVRFRAGKSKSLPNLPSSHLSGSRTSATRGNTGNSNDSSNDSGHGIFRGWITRSISKLTGRAGHSDRHGDNRIQPVSGNESDDGPRLRRAVTIAAPRIVPADEVDEDELDTLAASTRMADSEFMPLVPPSHSPAASDNTSTWPERSPLSRQSASSTSTVTSPRPTHLVQWSSSHTSL